MPDPQTSHHSSLVTTHQPNSLCTNHHHPDPRQQTPIKTSLHHNPTRIHHQTPDRQPHHLPPAPPLHKSGAPRNHHRTPVTTTRHQAPTPSTGHHQTTPPVTKLYPSNREAPVANHACSLQSPPVMCTRHHAGCRLHAMRARKVDLHGKASSD